MAYLEKLEAQINGGESTILEGKAKDDAPRRIAAWRRELLHLKRYYEQLDAIFDEMCDNDNGLIEANILARLEVLGRRTGRYLQRYARCRSWWPSCGRPIRASWPSSRTT